MRPFLAGVSLSLLLAQDLASADDRDRLVGTWRLVSWVMVDDATKEQKPLYGEHPHGSATFTPTGRAFFVLTGEGRKVPQTDEERGAALRSMLAYTGPYRVEGDKFITTVDTSWNEAWVGTEQARTYKVDGDRLHVVAMSQPAPNFGNRIMHGILTFEREGASPADAQHAPPDSPQARGIVVLVEKAAALVEKQGRAAFTEFRKKGSEWFTGTTYLFSYDMESNVLLNPAFPEREGTNTTGQKDATGKLFHAEIIRIADSKGSGWVDYRFPKPGQTQPSQKWTYVKRVNVDGVPGLIAAGFYPE